jgi:hypothetical protein
VNSYVNRVEEDASALKVGNVFCFYIINNVTLRLYQPFFSCKMIFYLLQGKGVCKCVKNIWKYALDQNMHDDFCVF